ncbi:MAG TPA: sigma-70 family RNA polymerase sigma factor [Tepidisphaeraceae bacterium]|nr:sigma-70 family RNA polymerase sigma factor [Tepidisphaeraceae bacterium]
MYPMDEAQLLAEFVQRRDEQAFAQIVRQHLGLVYSSALRQLRDSHQAEDAAQAVFIVLAHKAEKVRPAAALPGWLISTTRFVCKDMLRRQRRRMKYEREAAAMKPDMQDDPSRRDWMSISPSVDELLARLKEPDRSALVMRYLEDRSVGEIAVSLGTSEQAVSKRITRALAKLRRRFAENGLEVTTASISAGLLAHGKTSFAGHLEHSAATAALAASNSAAASGAAVFAKGAMTAMSTKSITTISAVVLALLLIGGTATYFVTHTSNAATVAQQPVKLAVATTHPSVDQWQSTHWAIIDDADNYSLDTDKGYPRFTVNQTGKWHVWLADFDQPIDPHRYPIIKMVYRSTNTTFGSSRYALFLNDGSAAMYNGGLYYCRAIDLIRDGKIHTFTANMDRRDYKGRLPTGDIEQAAIGVACDGHPPATFELISLTFEAAR